jgi:uncharacterized delta-60 repeat protein
MEKARAADQAGDHATAFKQYRRAAGSGIPEAQVRLGQMYEQGIGTERNYEKALEWYQKAAETGDLNGQAHLGMLFISPQGPGAAAHLDQAFKWLKKPAEAGNARAQGGLGYLYKVGFYGVPANFSDALTWLLRGADQGDPFAQFHLSMMYMQGEGVAKNEELAVEYLRKAALAGDLNAMRGYGMVLQTGRGVMEDRVEALRWLLLTAAKGDDLARANANQLQRTMSPEDIQEAQNRAATGLPKAAADASEPTASAAAEAPFKSPVFKYGTNPAVLSAVTLTDEAIFVGGNFDSVDGKRTPALVRLHLDGSLDWRFGQKMPPYVQSVRSVTLQRDKRILVVNFSNLIRLNPDGSQDTAFFPYSHTGNLLNVRVQPSGKILFLHADTSQAYIARLNTNATPDTSFAKINRWAGTFKGTDSGGHVAGFEVQADGRIIVVGQFDQVDGLPYPSIVRLEADGAIDRTFTPANLNALPGVRLTPGYSVAVSGLAIQPNGKILLRLGLGLDSGRGFRQVIRLNADGSYDASFPPVDVVNAHGRNTPAGSVNVLHLTEQSIYIAGFFGRVNETDVPLGFVRLDTKGQIDPRFQPGDLDFNDEIGFLASGTQRLIVGSHRRGADNSGQRKLTRLDLTQEK